MNEVLKNREVLLRNEKLYVLSMGYSDFNSRSNNRPEDDGYAEEAKWFGHFLRNSLHGNRCDLLLNNQCTRANIEEALTNLAQLGSKEDTLIVFYSGHGEADNLKLPVASNPNCAEIELFPKKDFFMLLENFKGRKIVIISACHGDYDQIPPNTLLVTPSKRNTVAYAKHFIYDIIGDVSRIGNPQNPLSDFVSLLLRKYHNKPYGPLDGRIWEHDPDYPDWKIYEDEKESGMVIFEGYQRANVRSTLMEGGVRLDVDPRCNFIPDH